MHVRTANGESVAISEVADIQLGLGLTAINRIDRDRTVTISADADATLSLIHISEPTRPY